VVEDDRRVRQLAANARTAGERWLTSAAEYAERMRELVER
jgi:hypothetical protein